MLLSNLSFLFMPGGTQGAWAIAGTKPVPITIEIFFIHNFFTI